MKQVEYTVATTGVPVTDSSLSSIAPSLNDSVALKRLLDEVRFDSIETASAATAYNRQHNRHNR